MKRTILSTLVGLVALSFGSAVFAAGIEEGKLTIWVNGDKGYDGIAKVGVNDLLVCPDFCYQKCP